MSLAELSRGRPRRDESRRTSRLRWIEEIKVVEDSECEQEAQIPESVGSKGLFLALAVPPDNDWLEPNLGRFLHCLRTTETDFWHDPVEPEAVEAEQILRESAELLAKLSHRPSGEIAEELRQWFLVGLSDDPAAREIVLEHFDGFVDHVDGDTAYVTLKSREHGDTLYGEYPAPELSRKGIVEQGRFVCRAVKAYRTTRVDIEAVPDGIVTEEQLRAIDEKIHRVLPRDDPGIEY